MIFAAGLVIEREPPRWDQVLPIVLGYLQNAGILAALVLLVWAIIHAVGSSRGSAGRRRPWTTPGLIFAGCGYGAAAGYLLFGALLLIQGMPSGRYSLAQNLALAAAGALALLAVSLQPLTALVTRVKARRVWAIARLSLKEATRGRVLYVFAIIGLVPLFAAYFISSKPEDQIRTYVTVIYLPMAILFLLLAGLLGSFSIPADVTRQTIHTIVTKPVERYEIVLGRFLGYAILLTVGLFGLTAVNLVYLARGITPQAAKESYKARVPIWAEELTFHGTGNKYKGENVGREWDYRSFIRGRMPQVAAGQVKQYAIFNFAEVPAAIANGEEPVLVEFTFDIYRTTKAEPGREGVLCTLTFAGGSLTVDQIAREVKDFEKERAELLKAKLPGNASLEERKEALQRIDDELIGKHRVYQVSGVQVVNFHTKSLEVPASLFRALAQGPAAPTPHGGREAPAPALKVLVSLGEDRNSSQQMIGVAPHDLYVLAGELPFWQNFFKGMIGLWCTVMLVLAVAVACSTYLLGVISLFVAGVVYFVGLFLDFCLSLAEGRLVGGGPIQAATRVIYNLPIGSPLDQTPGYRVGVGIDMASAWILRFVFKLFPDVQRYDLTNYVKEGFDIPWGRVILLDSLLPLAGYLYLWAILAYYLINAREIANPS